MRKITVGVMAVTRGCKGAANLIEIVFFWGGECMDACLFHHSR